MFMKVNRLAGVAAAMALVLLASACGPASHEGMVKGTVWVADEEGNSITVIDAGTHRVVTRLTGIEGPHNLQVAPNGKTVWAVSGHQALAVMIDATTYTSHGTVPTGKMPVHVILTPDGRNAYVTNSEDNTVTVIDAAGMRATATIPVGQYPPWPAPQP